MNQSEVKHRWPAQSAGKVVRASFYFRLVQTVTRDFVQITTVKITSGTQPKPLHTSHRPLIQKYKTNSRIQNYFLSYLELHYKFFSVFNQWKTYLPSHSKKYFCKIVFKRQERTNCLHLLHQDWWVTNCSQYRRRPVRSLLTHFISYFLGLPWIEPSV